eukprot:659340-Prorocentrum_minimum.AAC.1
MANLGRNLRRARISGGYFKALERRNLRPRRAGALDTLGNDDSRPRTRVTNNERPSLFVPKGQG